MRDLDGNKKECRRSYGSGNQKSDDTLTSNLLSKPLEYSRDHVFVLLTPIPSVQSNAQKPISLLELNFVSVSQFIRTCIAYQF